MNKIYGKSCIENPAGGNDVTGTVYHVFKLYTFIHCHVNSIPSLVEDTDVAGS